MNLQAKFALYNAITKIAIILVLGTIILLSLETISSHHLDTRLAKKRLKVIENLDDKEIDSLIKSRQSFTDYNILKEEFIVLTAIPKVGKIDTTLTFTSETREIEGEIEIYRILNDQFEFNNKRYKLEIGETMTAMESIKTTIRFYMLIVLVISLLVTLVTDYAFTNFILRPFYKIIDHKLNKVNNPTSYNYQNIPTNTTDFKILDNSINSLMRKISDLFLLEKQFIANVSHELLTPISILSGRLENILTADNLPIEHENKIFASLKTLNRLKVIINSLLLISKVENEQYLKKDNVSIKYELDEIYEDLEDRILDKKIVYQNHIKSDFIFTGNQALIHTLLVNVINNAIKYNVANGSITIEEELNSSNYTLLISDTGIGMEKENVVNAFNRFERENSENEEGFGLGLAIVNSIAKFHQINIDIKSEKNSGTVVSIEFPIS
ncbi:HAMP domain-containing histidine kinase [Pedobacter frigiditerrae]|uniref:histidine kinase n=1 Tax=Pedobacter frigiditerrae TaxID=2530452 RepID=A0A4V2MHL5_9SPHI|nr:HAMP domain-containing sensor histidine kinase [Pedobacter frigiditerrae]TCC86986.1 HAMP domain-containing histidine kinase [Pedobacter frigiditerrae]